MAVDEEAMSKHCVGIAAASVSVATVMLQRTERSVSEAIDDPLATERYVQVASLLVDVATKAYGLNTMIMTMKEMR